MLERIKELFTEITGRQAEELSENTTLSSEMHINSYELIRLVCALEDEYGTEISDHAARRFKTVGDVIGYIEANRQ